MRKPIIVGNWKMNKNNAETKAFFEAVDGVAASENATYGIGCPFTDLRTALDHAKNLVVAAENCHFEDSGAFTGEVSVPMLEEMGVKYCIIGHSERREMFGDTDETVNKKAKRLIKAGITPILCVGETEADYDAGNSEKVIREELAGSLADLCPKCVGEMVIAYEPIWAIGTGKSASVEIAENCCKIVRDQVKAMYGEEAAEKVRIQYGGSVKPNNIVEYMAQPDIDGALILETPDSVINTMFRYAKIRTGESICKTAGGYIHAPGGESYYAAIWANDQAEYVNPFFPYLGYWRGNESAINSFRHFARFMNPEFNPIPSSIIAEGTDIWAGAGDRGDAAMIAYGASRFSLTYADKAVAQELWPLIEWCLEYCDRKLNHAGVVMSDTDELEGRFEAGDANLCTSSLYYDALLSAASLSKELGLPSSVAKAYRSKAATLKVNIEKYYGATVSGFDTYRYYDGNDILRSWICIPLTVGIFDRAEATVDALCSPLLWEKDGLLTAQGSTTFWDRSTLYALRGIYAAGMADIATEKLKYYSKRRLLGNHVPYAIEAWPEGSQRHLAAESGLYCRIITEGMFGIRPTGFKSFDITPSMPSDWNEMALKSIRAFGKNIDVKVSRIAAGKLNVVIKVNGLVKNYKISEGAKISVKI